MTVERINPEAMHANPAFTQMIVVPPNTRTAIIGGQNAVNAKGEIVGKGDFAAQTAQALKTSSPASKRSTPRSTTSSR